MNLCKKETKNCVLNCFPDDRKAVCGQSNENNEFMKLRGIERLQKSQYNKGLAFTREERQFLGIHGLLPPVIKTAEQQLQHCTILINRLKSNINKYIYLQNLYKRNQRLFFQLIESNASKYLPLIYTPTVGEACLKFSLIFENVQGLYITIKDKGHVYDCLCNWPERDVRAIVVTDGERILGLGDLGANGMGIPIGKLQLYTALGGIKPWFCLPITLDCGTNTQSILTDPLYIGLRQERCRGIEYDEFIDEFMNAVVRRFSPKCLIQFEDFGNQNAFRLLEKYRKTFCTFNDDIQGTGTVVLAGILVAIRFLRKTFKDQVLLFLGAGEASIGTAYICQYAMMREGLTLNEAKERIWLFDTKGLVVIDRPTGGLTPNKLDFAHEHEPIENLLESIEICRPTILIGASATRGLFSREILQLMAKINERPIIFALSNPTAQSECTAHEAYKYTNGKCLYASGSPFPPGEFRGKKYKTQQSNNSIIFPGIALGVLCSGMLTIPEEVFYIAAETLADLCMDEDVAQGSLYPPLEKAPCNSIEIAKWIMEYAYRFNLATVYPEPANKREFIKSQQYNYKYTSVVPNKHEGYTFWWT